MNLSGNTIIVTGGTSGIGLAVARELLKRGNKVIIIGRNQMTIDKVLEENKELVGLQGDVSSLSSVRKMTAFINENYPEANILFNSAGIMRPFELLDENVGLEDVTAEIETNLNGTIWMTKAMLPQLATQKEAMIVTISSGLSYVSSPNHPVYSATKAGIRMFTDALRIQLRKSGKKIHVMELIPPIIVETNLEPDVQNSGWVPNMSLDSLVKHCIKGMELNKTRVVPGFAKVIRFVGKIFL